MTTHTLLKIKYRLARDPTDSEIEKWLECIDQVAVTEPDKETAALRAAERVFGSEGLHRYSSKGDTIEALLLRIQESKMDSLKDVLKKKYRLKRDPTTADLANWAEKVYVYAAAGEVGENAGIKAATDVFEQKILLSESKTETLTALLAKIQAELNARKS